MTIREFNSLEEIQKYYDKRRNTYIFEEDGNYIGLVIFRFDLKVRANIRALNIIGRDIEVLNIKALDIRAGDINALDIVAGNINAVNINAKDIDAFDIDAVNVIARDMDVDNISVRKIDVRDINGCIICDEPENIKCKSIQGGRKDD